MSLNLEQEFALRSFASQTAHLNKDDLHKLLVDTYRVKLEMEGHYKSLIGVKWGFIDG